MNELARFLADFLTPIWMKRPEIGAGEGNDDRNTQKLRPAAARVNPRADEGESARARTQVIARDFTCAGRHVRELSPLT